MDLDRVGPSRRDACRTRNTGRQTWRDLLFLHWEVPVSALRPLLPGALAVDTFEGRAYVGLVPFTMHAVHFGPLRVADFLETNLRTYVHAEGVPGVWFLSLEAESAIAVWGARMFYRLPYFHARMHCAVQGGSVAYESHRRRAHETTLRVRWTAIEPEPHQARTGTLEHFLTERYALYGPARGQDVYRLRVHHKPWPLRRARVEALATTIQRAAGIEVKDPIDLALASPEGVNVETFARESVAPAVR